MTVREWAVQYCFERLMREEEAKEIVERVIADPLCKDMAHRWEKDTSGYPAFMLSVLAASIKRHALKYLDEKYPGAANRELFI